MGYTLVRDNNKFTVTKTDVFDIFVTVYVKQECKDDEWIILNPEVSTSTSLVIILPNKDNLYKFSITDRQTILDVKYIPLYTNLLKSLVKTVEKVLCDCDCVECEESENDYLSAILKLMSYNIINDNFYNNYLALTNECVKCNIFETNACLFGQEMLLGTGSNKELMKKIIAYYYLVFYFTDIKVYGNTVNTNTLYNFDAIMKCITTINIDKNCIKNTIIELPPDGIFTLQLNNIFN